MKETSAESLLAELRSIRTLLSHAHENGNLDFTKVPGADETPAPDIHSRASSEPPVLEDIVDLDEANEWSNYVDQVFGPIASDRGKPLTDVIEDIRHSLRTLIELELARLRKSLLIQLESHLNALQERIQTDWPQN